MLLILFLVALCIVSVLSVQSKPNIVFFLVDDVGTADIGFTSMTKTIPTPFINKLASTSGAVRLNQYYAQSLCTPTRASLLTGRYAYNVGLTFVIIPASPSGIPSNIETLPEILEREGYRSYIHIKDFTSSSAFILGILIAIQKSITFILELLVVLTIMIGYRILEDQNLAIILKLSMLLQLSQKKQLI